MPHRLRGPSRRPTASRRDEAARAPHAGRVETGTVGRPSDSELHFEPQLGELAREILEVEPAGRRLNEDSG